LTKSGFADSWREISKLRNDFHDLVKIIYKICKIIYKNSVTSFIMYMRLFLLVVASRALVSISAEWTMPIEIESGYIVQSDA
jgi:hypothetical protein